MAQRPSAVSNWATSERAAWAAAASEWRVAGSLALGIAIGLIAGVMIANLTG